jgi:hypothetical protein
MATASNSHAVVDKIIVGRPPVGRNLQDVTANVHRRLTFDLRQSSRSVPPRGARQAQRR